MAKAKKTMNHMNIKWDNSAQNFLSIGISVIDTPHNREVLGEHNVPHEIGEGYLHAPPCSIEYTGPERRNLIQSLRATADVLEIIPKIADQIEGDIEGNIFED